MDTPKSKDAQNNAVYDDQSDNIDVAKGFSVGNEGNANTKGKFL